MIRAGGVALFVVAGVLLTSIGGAGIVAAPVTLPLLFLVARRRPTRPFRVVAAVLGGLTAAELSWGLLYLGVGDVAVANWLVPDACGTATACGLLWFTHSPEGAAGVRWGPLRR